MFKARLAKSADIPTLLAWAKSKRNRSVNFGLFINDKETKKLVVTMKNKPIGVVFLTGDQEIALFLTPRHHGKGLGQIVLFEAHEWILRYWKNIGYVWANPGSMASIRLFRSMGYERGEAGDWFREI